MNRRLFKSVMALNGDNQKDLSEFLGITEQTFSRKLNENNDNGFSQSEIKKIVQKYKLDADQISQIFFSSEVS